MASTKDRIVETAIQVLLKAEQEMSSKDLSKAVWAELAGTDISDKIAKGKGWMNRSIYFHAMSLEPKFHRLRRGVYCHSKFKLAD